LFSVSGNESVGPFSQTLVDETFDLLPGVTYMLSADLIAGAQVVPEPSSSILVIGGLLELLYRTVAKRQTDNALPTGKRSV
jgi:hypothetical protein